MNLSEEQIDGIIYYIIEDINDEEIEEMKDIIKNEETVDRILHRINSKVIKRNNVVVSIDLSVKPKNEEREATFISQKAFPLTIKVNEYTKEINEITIKDNEMKMFCSNSSTTSSVIANAKIK